MKVKKEKMGRDGVKGEQEQLTGMAQQIDGEKWLHGADVL